MVRASVRTMNDDDEWINAGCAMMASIRPDLGPMIALLRGHKPVPRGIRDLLADLLAPGDSPPYSVRLTLEFTRTQEFGTPRKENDFFKKWVAVGIYDRLRAEGASEKEALGEANKIFPCEKTSFHKARIAIHERAPELFKIWSQKLSKNCD
jgi:hypothetical protein